MDDDAFADPSVPLAMCWLRDNYDIETSPYVNCLMTNKREYRACVVKGVGEEFSATFDTYDNYNEAAEKAVLEGAKFIIENKL